MITKLIARTSCLLLAGSTFVYAGGFSVSGVGANGSAMQAFTAVADDSSAIYYNPAGITQLDKEVIMSGGEFIFPTIRYNNADNGITTKSTQSAVGGHLFYVKPFKNKWRFGIGVYSPFARPLLYQTNAATLGAPLGAYIRRIDVTPTLALKVNDKLSIGVSAVISHIKSDTALLGLVEHGNGYGYTAQAGLLWKLTEKIRLGASYRGAEVARIEGNATLNGTKSSNYTTKLNMPAVFNIGVAFQANKRLLASVEYNNEMWSSLQNIVKNYSNPDPAFNQFALVTLNAKNSANYRGGIAFAINETNKLFGGYTYSKGAIPVNNAMPSTPEFNSNVYAIGFSHKEKKYRVDVSYEYSQLLNNTKTSVPLAGSYWGYAQRIFFNIAVPI